MNKGMITSITALVWLSSCIAGGASAGEVQSVDARHVRLLPGNAFYDRQELHRTGYLAEFQPDRLLYDYRKFAKLEQPEGVSEVWTGWDTSWLRGHMMGHYLSAASRMAVATSDDSFRTKVNDMVSVLAECQDAIDENGYLAAFPSGAFDRLEGKQGDSGGVVVPYYIIHKIMAGLLDAHHYLGNEQALGVAVKMGDYFSARLEKVSPEHLDKMFRTDGSRNPQNEFGAMNDVLAELAEVTGDQKYLKTARLFNRPWFMEPLSTGEDHLEGLHANTHVAQAVGLAHCANLSNDPAELAGSANFWKMVTQDHLFVIGGNSFNEWFDEPGVEVGPSINDEKKLPPTTAETCNTHNMLKLTSYLFEREQKAEYADFYERALYNHLLASVAPDTGRLTYFTPLHGHFRTYLDGTHCCVGSGIENPPRYNENIYFQDGRSLWVNLYIPSELNWEETGLVLRQEGDVTKGEKITFTVVKAGKESAMNFRIPGWVSKPAPLKFNGKVVESEGTAAGYLTLKRKWKQGDVITLKLPVSLRIEKADDDPSMVSIFYGPVLLSGELGKEDMPNDFADKDAHLKLAPADVPDIITTSVDPADWLKPIEGETIAFAAREVGLASGVVFRPLYEVHHQRYSVYWRFVDGTDSNE